MGKYVIISVILYIIEKVVNFKSRGIFSGQKFISTYDAAYNTVLYYLNSDSKLDDLKTMPLYSYLERYFHARLITLDLKFTTESINIRTWPA